MSHRENASPHRRCLAVECWHAREQVVCNDADCGRIRVSHGFQGAVRGLLTAQTAFGGRAMACQGAGCVSGTWTGGPCSGTLGLYCCVGSVKLELPRAFWMFSMRAAASADTAPRSNLPRIRTI